MYWHFLLFKYSVKVKGLDSQQSQAALYIEMPKANKKPETNIAATA
jgi:hypothetical protein